jgi:histidine triad (HIT) family protein
MEECIFCQIINGKIPTNPVYQDENYIVIHDIHPRAPVHMLVIPKTHVAAFMDADDTLLTELTSVVKKIIREKNVRSYRIVTNGDGAAVIDHFHIHIMGQVDKNRDL